MASKYTGVAVIFGFAGSVSFSGSGTFIKETGDLEQDGQVDDLTDDDNEVVSLIHSKETFMFNFLFTPRAATASSTSLASAKLSMAPPVQGARVTLSGFPVPAGNDFINSATWTYVGGFKLAFKKNGLLTYAMKIRRHLVNDLSAPATA